MLLAKIVDTANGREELLMQRHAWHMCPYVLGYKPVCGYWETRCELFMFACETAGMNCETAEWIDGATGEVLTFWDLSDEEIELFEDMEA